MSLNLRNTLKRHKKTRANFETMVYTLFGAYIIPRGGEVWVGSLIELLKPLGLSENAVRLGLSRMSRKGVFKRKKKGRKSYYSLSKKGLEKMSGGRERGLERDYKNWDGKWRIVVYTIPEKLREDRNNLREKLKDFGFGNLGNSIWISPYNIISNVVSKADKMGISQYVDIFEGEYFPEYDEKGLLERAWQLEDLREDYENYIREYSDKLNKLKKRIEDNDIEGSKVFAERFLSMAEYIDVSLDDPMLPVEILPDNWPGYRAREIQRDYQKLLKPYAESYIDNLLGEE